MTAEVYATTLASLQAPLEQWQTSLAQAQRLIQGLNALARLPSYDNFVLGVVKRTRANLRDFARAATRNIEYQEKVIMDLRKHYAPLDVEEMTHG